MWRLDEKRGCKRRCADEPVGDECRTMQSGGWEEEEEGGVFDKIQTLKEHMQIKHASFLITASVPETKRVKGGILNKNLHLFF